MRIEISLFSFLLLCALLCEVRCGSFPLVQSERLVSPYGGGLGIRNYFSCSGLWICGQDISGDSAVLAQEPLLCGNPDPSQPLATEPARIFNSTFFFASPGKDCSIDFVTLNPNVVTLLLQGEATTNADGSPCSLNRVLWFFDATNNQSTRKAESISDQPLTRGRTFYLDWANSNIYAGNGIIYSGAEANVSNGAAAVCQDDIFPTWTIGGKKRAKPTTHLRYRMYFTNLQTFFTAPPIGQETYNGTTDTFFTFYEPIFNEFTTLQGIGDAHFVLEDFDLDGAVDIFMCGTVWNTVTLKDEAYTAIWKNTGTQGFSSYPPAFTEYFVFPYAVTHCAAAAADFDGDGYKDIFFSGTTGAQLKCGVFLNNGSGIFLESAATASQIQCVSHGDAAAGDIDGDGYPDLVVLGDPSTSGGNIPILNPNPPGASTSIYMNVQRSAFLPVSSRLFQFDSNLRALRKGSVKIGPFYTSNQQYQDIIISGENNAERGTWAYLSTFAGSTYSTSASSIGAQAAAAAAGAQAASLSALAAAGLLDSTTAALAASLSTANAAGQNAATALSALTSTGTTSTATSSTFATSSSTSSSTSSTSSTRTTAVTTAAATFAVSVSDIATSLTSAAATASAATAGAAFAPISNELQAIVLPPVSVAVDSEQGSLSVTPLFDEVGRSDLPRVQYQVRAVKFTEYDTQTLEVLSCPAPTGTFTTSSSRGTAPGGGDTTVTIFSALLCNDALLEVRYTQYTTSDTITFAGVSFGVQPQSVKVAYTISKWRFAKPANTLEVQFEMVVNQTSTQAISTSIIPRGSNLFLWNIRVNSLAYITSLIVRSGLVDFIPTPLDIYPSDNNFFRINVRTPSFLRSVTIDPNFDVLLDDRSTKKKSGNGAKIGAGVGVGVAVLVVAGVIIGVLLFKKKKTASFGSSGSKSGGQA